MLQVVDDATGEATPRRAKWWYVTFHNVTAMVGAGVLSLPYAMSELGWYVIRRDASTDLMCYTYK